MTQIDWQQLTRDIKAWGTELGFQQVGISDTELSEHHDYLQRWLANGYQGELNYMADHGDKRSHPQALVPGTLRVISARMNYLSVDAKTTTHEQKTDRAVVSRYALGRDYHKMMRKRLAKLAEKITDAAGDHQHRAFVDSAPVLERALAEKAGLGWIGKNTLLLNREAGSYFFLGEIYTDLPLPVDQPTRVNHCGSCTACLDLCPTNAFVAPYVLDARKCISYLTIELKGSIPEPLRPKMGNRIFGCDDCQAVCPWNRFAQPTAEDDFQPRNDLEQSELIALFNWSEDEFLRRTQGSAIRRTGWEGWLRNIAVALGNALNNTPYSNTPSNEAVVTALRSRLDHPSAVVREHVEWALKQHQYIIAKD